jgi:hypothetical protein
MPDESYSFGRTRKITLCMRSVILQQFCRDKPFGMALDEYLAEMLESIWAERRASKIRATPLEPLAPKEECAAKLGAVSHRQMSPANAQRILHLRLSEGLSIEIIAARMGCSRSTVAYVLAQRRNVTS